MGTTATRRSRRGRSLLAVLATTVVGLAGAVTPQPATADVDAAAEAPVDVYTTPGEHVVNGRRWLTQCQPYSSTVERCRTEIWATKAHWTGTAYVSRNGWVFNNLTYLPSPRAHWVGNPLATPGEHLIEGRRWKTECDTPWTGQNGCRSMIWSTYVAWNGTAWRPVEQWVFNNIVHLLPEGATAPAMSPLAMAAPRMIDPLATVTVHGRLNTGEEGASVAIDVWFGTRWSTYKVVTTGTDGRWSFDWGYGAGVLGSTTIRARATTASGEVIESAPASITRMRWANAVVTQTTTAEVAKTYRSGCPVGPSSLRTIRINQQGLDGRIHRGEIIVRDVHATRVVNVFTRIFEAGFPVAMMRNPNEWNGSDTAMMAANNTSGFNCRSVVGNPYAQSPHSYGIAVDVNPVQNPYRDPNGKWWPSTQYVSRTPVVPGMLTSGSAPVVAFRDNSFEWYSGWDWHHFQYKAGYGSGARMVSSASTAGPLAADDLLVPEGWSGRAASTTSEDGLLPNGFWAHAVGPAIKSSDLLTASCALADDNLPQPTAALEGTLADAEGRPGVSVALHFASADDAAAWFGFWREASRACAGTTPVRSSEDTWLAERDVDGPWGEVAGVRGSTVHLVTFTGDSDEATLDRLAAQLDA